MKKFLTFVLVCCLVFSSSSTVFATATQWDTSDQANLSNAATRLQNIYNLLNNTLNYGGKTIAYWVNAIDSWMQPIYSSLTDIFTSSLNIEPIAGLLGSTEVVSGTTVRTPYLFYNGKSVAQYNSSIDNLLNNQFLTARTVVMMRYRNGQLSNENRNMTFADALNTIHNYGIVSFAYMVEDKFKNILTGYNNTQSITNWSDLSTSTFTPTSMSSGIYSYLANIQAPVARLSYVLASDERIEAQEAAAANEEAVVDNFIDSSGAGSASTSDFGSVSDLSSGFKNNISTDASVSGIWNIFNSDNFGWFSQETADQLDTSGSGTRTLRSSGSYPTPLLDKQTEDIMNILGGSDND